ncbi:MAG: hypothetical protein J0H06_08475 [Actinobacteria bacterium]|nr:hypothetical protein [Actinomycetota bacterium]
MAAAGIFAAGAVGGSVSLLMFGVDAAIVGFASTILLVRTVLGGMPGAERLAGARLILAIQFFALAALATVDSVYSFLSDRHSDPGILGICLIVVTGAALVAIGGSKIRIGVRLGSSRVHRQGADDMWTAGLAFAVAIACLVVAVGEVWVADQLGALLVAGLAVAQGFECGRGEVWGPWRVGRDPREEAA